MLKKLIIPIVILIIFVIAALSWWFTGQKEEAGPQTSGLPMKVARSYWPGQYSTEIADKKGWFQEAGLNVELIDTNPDYFASLQDMVDGKMDTNSFSLFDLITFKLQGADLVMVVNTASSFGANSIVARQDIKTTLDLKGKRIGVSKNTYLEYILSIVLGGNQLTLDDVIAVNMPAEKAAEEFIKGTVDAIVTWEPFVTEALQKGRGHKLFDTSEIPGILTEGLAFHRSFIEERPGDVQAFVHVWHKTIQFIKENPSEAFGIIAKIYNKTPDEVQAFAQSSRIYGLRENVTAFTYGAGFESLHGTARQINNFIIRQGITNKQLDSTKFLDARFIRAIKWDVR